MIHKNDQLFGKNNYSFLGGERTERGREIKRDNGVYRL